MCSVHQGPGMGLKIPIIFVANGNNSFVLSMAYQTLKLHPISGMCFCFHHHLAHAFLACSQMPTPIIIGIKNIRSLFYFFVIFLQIFYINEQGNARYIQACKPVAWFTICLGASPQSKMPPRSTKGSSTGPAKNAFTCSGTVDRFLKRSS